MTFRMGKAFFSGYEFRRGACAVILLGAGLALAGCGGGATVADAVPVSQGARDTGSYPNLNIKPEVAARQFTDEERDAKLSSLRAAQVRAAASPGATTEAADAATMNKLAKSHAKDTLKQIEGACDPALDPTCK